MTIAGSDMAPSQPCGGAAEAGPGISRAIRFTGYTAVTTPVKTGEMIAWGAAALLITVGVVFGLLSGRFEVLVGFAALPFLWGKTRRASGGSEARLVQVTFSFDPASRMLSVFMPGARLWGSDYVDQLYRCALSQIDSVFFNARGTFFLRANPLQSIALRGSDQLGVSELPYSEVSISVDGDTRMAITAFFAQMGIQCAQV